MDETNPSHIHLSRRERRQMLRGQGALHSRTHPLIRKSLIWGGSLLVLGLIAWGMSALSSRTITPAGNGTLAVPVNESDNFQGPADAPVTLVEYSDFQCPACAAFFPVVKQALAEPQLKDKVKFVYRAFPLTTIHANAELASRAALAAAAQGKFWEMHDALFKGQSSWAKLSGGAARGIFLGYAKELGVDTAAFESALDSAAVKKAVKEQSDGAVRSGVNSTPTFFINGKEMPQPSSYDAFRQFLIDALNANP